MKASDAALQVEDMVKSKKSGKVTLLSGRDICNKAGSLSQSRRKFNNWLVQVMSVVFCIIAVIAGYFMM
jgi:hypothetical protein